MTLPKCLADRQRALEHKKALLQKLQARKPVVTAPQTQTPEELPEPGRLLHREPENYPSERFGEAKVGVYRDDDSIPSSPGSGLENLVNLYLSAARNRSSHVVLMWPVALRTVSIVHVLATLERWAQGDKRGIRGLLFPTKTNVFQPLNHLHIGRTDVLRHARALVELQTASNQLVTRPQHEKDAFLFSLASLKPEENELFNPTMSELIPHFLAGPDWKVWGSCAAHLLEHIGAKLARRAQKKALRTNCNIIGSPATAPDALFALDGRLGKEELRKALRALKKVGAPEVVMVNATRQIRKESPSWRSALVKFCLLLEEVFGKERPGVLLVTDDPRVAFNLKDDLWKGNKARPRDQWWHSKHEYAISAMASTMKVDGLVPPGKQEIRAPHPREFDLAVVDGEAAKVVNALYRLAGTVGGAPEQAQPLWQAGSYLSKLAALPCGVSTVVEWLSESGIRERTRAAHSWLTFHAALVAFDRQAEDGIDRRALKDCMAQGTRLYENYRNGTPLALRLADLVGSVCGKQHKAATVVFTTPIYRRLAERFLSTYPDYQGGLTFPDFSERLSLITSAQLEQKLEGPIGPHLIFCGLDEESLRLLITDNRIQAHAQVLVTQHTGQGLRALLHPLVNQFDAFRSFKPRMESLLRQLQHLPVVNGLSANRDFELPTFRVDLSADVEANDDAEDPEAWRIRLDSGETLHRRPTRDVYVYDPTGIDATEPGFRCCKVQTLVPGDKLFVMSSELRELVELVLKDAGVPIEHDKSFEKALRDYHLAILKSLDARFPGNSLSDQVRQLRSAILAGNPKLEKFPAEAAVRHWVNLGSSPDTPFDQLRPQAPMKEAHFRAFAAALGFDSLVAAVYWQGVIMAIRNARRIDGRHVSDMYAHMLLQPESAMVHSHIKRQTLKMLFQKARENIVTVDAVIPPQEG